MANSAEIAIPVAGQAVAPVVALQGEISKATESFSKTSSVHKPATGISPVAIDGQARKDIASGAKTRRTDTAMTVTAGAIRLYRPKTDMSPEKMPAVAIAARK